MQEPPKVEYTHWQQSIGHAGSTPGRGNGYQSSYRRNTQSSWSARSVADPIRPFSDSSQRRTPRVPTFLPRFSNDAKVLGRSGAQPLPPSAARQLGSARARLGSTGRMLGTPRGSTPRSALPFGGPPGRVGRIKTNAKLTRGSQVPAMPPAAKPAVMRMEAAFKFGEFGGEAGKLTLATNALEMAKMAKEQLEKKQCKLERQQKELDALLESLRDAFRAIDKDHNGTVEPGEVLAMVKLAGNKVNEAQFWDNFNQVDKDHNGLIDEQEFLAILTQDLEGPVKDTVASLNALSEEAKHAKMEADRVLDRAAKEVCPIYIQVCTP